LRKTSEDANHATPDDRRFLREVPKTGVIFVTEEARRAGYREDDPEWANLGQGQPESGPLEGAPPRVGSIQLLEHDGEYAPTAGLAELREAVARLYNDLFRKGKKPYTAKNVCISGGGRLALARTAAALDAIHLGHFLPDYTAYEELLELFKLFSAMPIPLNPEESYRFSAHALREKILDLGLGAVLMSNPCNPTGKLIYGEELRRFVETARSLSVGLLFDEYYSHYIWNEFAKGEHGVVSAAAYVDDPEEDDVLIFDGLTKNWRYPGWRVGWVLGPSRRIDALSSVASFLDGGCSRPMQRAALPLLDPEHTRRETAAIRARFGHKRRVAVERLQRMGIRIEGPPDGTFYVWGSVQDLPAPLNDGFAFFRAALKEKVICVPGLFFDVNPGKRRPSHRSRFGNHIRFSFGPALETLERGFGRLEAMIARAR
jgi:aspartate/methionine/tyrosine aminotransferase